MDYVKDSGTSHLSLIAPNGDAVAATSSINTWLISYMNIIQFKIF